MTDPTLPLLVAILAALLGIGAVAAFAPPGGRQVIGFATTGICGVGSLLSLMSLLLLAEPAAVDLPVGPPGMALHLVLDPLASFFLLLVFVAGTASLACATESPQADAPATLAGLATCVAGLVLTLLAGDGVGLATGLACAGVSLWASGEPGQPRATILAVLLAAAGLMLVAITLLTPHDVLPRFEAIRATSSGPRHAAAALIVTLLGGGLLAGLAPLHAWMIPAHVAMPARSAALLSGGVLPVAIYALLRIPVDLAGGTPPLWWGLPFLLMGAASAVIGGWRSAIEPDIDAVLAASSLRLAGLAAIGIGLVLFGRAADLPNLVALALAAVLLISASQAICATLLLLCAGAVRFAAGTRRLDRLGGLIHHMPITALATAAGLSGLLSLPPGVVFAGSWLLFQALLAAPRAGGLAPQILLAGLAAVLAWSGALAAASSVRLFGVAFLGRPRTARASAADDVTRQAHPALLGLGAIAILLGLLPGVVLRLLAGPAIRLLAATGLGSRADVLGLAPGAEAPGYAALPLAALVAVCGGVTYWLSRRRRGIERSSPPWHDGFAPPPAWLPFGDPLAQSDGSGFVPHFPRPKRRLALPDWPSIPRSVSGHAAGLWAVLIVIAALLVMLTVLGGI